MRRLEYLRAALLAFSVLGAVGFAVRASAEPYLAVTMGLKCVSCHTNPTGGGKRNAFGEAFAREVLPTRTVAAGSDVLPGQIARWLSIGGDLRAGLNAADVPGADRTSEFGVSRATLYAALTPIPGLVTVYADELVAPQGASAREAYALITPSAGRYTLKVGKFFLPYGWRLQDDSAFVRQASGINFTTPDSGVEAGLELPRWSAQAALTNGTAGGPENDAGKQLSLQASYVRTRWRVGAGVNVNNAALGDRDMATVFAGLRTGPIAWLAEIDAITDEVSGGDVDRRASLLEGNWRFRKGHNLKVTYEFLDPSRQTADDARERYSLVWEHAPVQFLQARIGWRSYHGVASDPASGRTEVFAELHGFF